MPKFQDNIEAAKQSKTVKAIESPVTTIYARAIAPERAPTVGIVEVFNMAGSRDVYVDGKLQAQIKDGKSVAAHLFSKGFARDCLAISGVEVDEATFAVVDWESFKEVRASMAKQGRAQVAGNGEYLDFHKKVGHLGGIGEGHARLLGVGLVDAEIGIERNFEK